MANEDHKQVPVVPATPATPQVPLTGFAAVEKKVEDTVVKAVKEVEKVAAEVKQVVVNEEAKLSTLREMEAMFQKGIFNRDVIFAEIAKYRTVERDLLDQCYNTIAKKYNKL